MLLSHFPWPGSLTWVFARGLAYQPSAALGLVTAYQLYYFALDFVGGVSLARPSPHPPHSDFSSFIPLSNLTAPLENFTVRGCGMNARANGIAHICTLVFYLISHRGIHIPLPTYLGTILLPLSPHCYPTGLDGLCRSVDRTVYRSWGI